MSILNAVIVRWAELTKYVIYRKRGAFDSAHAYTLNIFLYPVAMWLLRIYAFHILTIALRTAHSATVYHAAKNTIHSISVKSHLIT